MVGLVWACLVCATYAVAVRPCVSRRTVLNAAGLASSWGACTKQARAVRTGEELFEKSCAACHAEGGNIVVRGKTLSKKDLEKNGYATMASIEDLITRGKNAMPGFGESCEPKRACTYGPRLTSTEIAEIAAYAGTAWP